MRHDAKLGLALGMLVIGFAVAFCFPRQPARIQWVAPAPAPVVDSTLNFLPIRAYQSPIVPPPETTEPRPEAPPIPPLPGTSDPTTAAISPDLIPAPAPISPIVEVSPVAVVAASPVPEQEEPTPTIAVSAAPPEPVTYRVKAGDTLSGIASKSLGSSARFQELFEANKEILSSPDDLKIGMELRIPSRTPPATEAAPMLAEQQNRQPQQPWKGITIQGAGQVDVRQKPYQNPPAAPWLTESPSPERR